MIKSMRFGKVLLQEITVIPDESAGESGQK
jgi:hypothetical protein